MVKLVKLHSYTQTKDLRSFFKEILSESYNYFLFSDFYINMADYIYILEEEKRIIGAVIGIKEQSDTGTIGMLGIKKEFRKRGYAKFLVKIVLNTFLENQITTVYVETDENNYYAMNLYKSIGFVVTEFYERYYTDCSNALKLQICLKKKYEIENIQEIENFKE